MTVPSSDLEYIAVKDAAQRDLISSTSPLLFNPTTHEPYLPLPSNPRRNVDSEFVLTPSRLSDVDAQVPVLNSPSVRECLYSVPNPATRDTSLAFYERNKKDLSKTLESWTANEVPWGSPVNTIRERKKDGTEVYVGDIFLHRESRFLVVPDEAKAAKLGEENLARKPGDPDILWSVGFLLSEEYAGQGLMTDVLSTVIHSFFVPVLKGRVISSGAFTGNEGSRRVHLKCGFVQEDKILSLKMREDRGGHMRENWQFKWTKDGSQ